MAKAAPLLSLPDDLLAVIISPYTSSMILSRISHSFVVVSIRYFQIKSMAHVKAWAKLSDISNRENFSRELDAVVETSENKDLLNQVPRESYMREYITNSPV